MFGLINSVPLVKYTSATAKIVFHGNSLVYGASGATDPMPAQVYRSSLINQQVICSNQGVNGQTTQDMINSGGTIDNLFATGKSNVLVVWEGHNSINTLMNGGASGEEATASAWEQMKTYVAQRLAAKPWKIVLMTVLPSRRSIDTNATCNSINDAYVAYNDLMKAEWRSIGASALVDMVQPGSPFIMPDWSLASFEAISLWSEGDGGQWVHLNNEGYGVIAEYVVDKLRRLRR